MLRQIYATEYRNVRHNNVILPSYSLSQGGHRLHTYMHVIELASVVQLGQ